MHNTSPLSPKNDYRPDIDGLRAIAVVAVVGYHAFPSIFPGGFVGVDIFFVISGYLISKHIWEELALEKFSIKTFYERRVRRIFPALIIVLLFCLFFGWVVLTPGEYEQLGKHITGGAGFVSNLIYWKEAGYFDNAADTKPLLHLWSLGIEEQFYIFWPLILAWLWRQPHHAKWVLPSLLVASFIYSQIVVTQNVVADFYSPLTRFWELGLGAMIAHKSIRNYKLDTNRLSALSWAGFALILISIAIVNHLDPFPGAWALLPAMGAAFIIKAGDEAWLNQQLLARKWIVWVGLISYPLYLWHWPLLSFARIMESATPSPSARASLIVASIILAWITYELVEKPIRSRHKYIVLGLCIAMILVALLGEAVRKLDGVKTRKLSMLNGDPTSLILGGDRNKLQHECGLSDEQKPLFQYCLRNLPNPNHALLGDSKAEALFYGLVRESPAEIRWAMIGSVAPPGVGSDQSEHQKTKNQLALNTILNNPEIKVVAWVATINGLFKIDSETGFIVNENIPSGVILAYSQAIQQLESAGKRVIFVIDNPTLTDPRNCISGGLTSSPFLNIFLQRKENPRCSVTYVDHLAGVRLYYEFTEELKRQNPNLIVYDPTPLLCDVANNTCSVTKGEAFLYSYSNHISDYSNSMIARDMLPTILRIKN